MRFGFKEIFTFFDTSLACKLHSTASARHRLAENIFFSVREPKKRNVHLEHACLNSSTVIFSQTTYSLAFLRSVLVEKGSVELNNSAPIDKRDGVVSQMHRMAWLGDSGRAVGFILGSHAMCGHATDPNLFGS